ncbi:hypothetical protein [Chitinophaga arvensicola]|uniref:Peptidase n=1 Tax=Chitinophaga arvensicola TaxID=29529 RepID=A0A1I0SEF4_9BACT|nr:hypothetical protein [Chitinophaga arvensicola]SEW57493.1 hypothetical protein SAMN04488122_6810 [Chitinophaga arvensicola]
MNKLIITTITLILAGISCSQKEETIPLTGNQKDPNAPSVTWQEHWFEHNQLVTLVSYNDDVAMYYDDNVSRELKWPLSKLTAIWKYTKATYGAFGQDKDRRLNVILHYKRYGGGHPSTYFDASHDFRNMIDVGSDNPWEDSTGWNVDIVTHEVGHIVEGASKGVHNSPAFGIWHDSKWMEIYQYDVYKNLGWNQEADRWYNAKLSVTDNYPQANTHWFRDWFYPIYQSYGGKDVLNGFFTLLSRYFPQHNIALGKEYDRAMNMGEFIHFWSGAAHKDLSQLARNAFGPNDEAGNSWQVQLDKARIDFAAIVY